MERLRPLAQRLRTACGTLDVPVYEALCISDGRFWSYCCPDARCCPPEGSALALPGTSVMAAAAAYAGIQVRGSLRQMEGRLAPWTTPAAAGPGEGTGHRGRRAGAQDPGRGGAGGGRRGDPRAGPPADETHRGDTARRGLGRDGCRGRPAHHP